MKGERENRLTVDVIEKDTMFFLELMELIYENLQNCQTSKKIPGAGWAYTRSVCPSLYFPLLTDPSDRFARQTGAGHFLEGGSMGREGLQPQVPHICSASLSLGMHTNKRPLLASLFMFRKIKSGHLRQGEERMKQKQSSEITTKGTSCTCKSNTKGEVEFLQSDSSSCTSSLGSHENVGFFSAFVSPPAKRGQCSHNHFAKCIRGLAGYHLSYKQSYESAKEYF